MTAVTAEDWPSGFGIFDFSEWACEEEANILALEESQRQPTLSGNGKRFTRGCSYRLGDGLFRELRSTLGDAEFRRGFAKLYLLRKDRDGPDRCYGFRWAICYVEKAFVRDASKVRNADMAQRIIDKWYEGTPLQ